MIRSRHGLDSIASGKKGLVLEIDVVEAVTLPQFLEPHANGRGVETDPLAPIDEGIRTEGAAKIAALRGDEVELTASLQLEVSLDGNQAIIVRTEPVDRPERTSGVLLNPAVRKTHGAAGAVFQPTAIGQTVDDFGERFFTLSLHTDVDRWLDQAVATKHRRMPSTPDDRQIRSKLLGRARNHERIGYWRAREHRDAQTHGVIEVRAEGGHGVRVEAAVDDHDLVYFGIEFRTNRQQRERHREEDRLRVVENDFQPRPGRHHAALQADSGNSSPGSCMSVRNSSSASPRSSTLRRPSTVTSSHGAVAEIARA